MGVSQADWRFQVKNVSIVNADVNATAAIATSKLADGAHFLKDDGTVPMQADFDVNAYNIINLADPVNPLDGVNLRTLQAYSMGLQMKPTATYATAAGLPAYTYSNGTLGVGATLTAMSNGALTVDGSAVAVNDIVLVKDETGGAAVNGLYVVTQAGDGSHPYILTRHTSMDQSGEFGGAFIVVEYGTANSGSAWICNATLPVTVGATAIPFTRLFNGTLPTGTTGQILTYNASNVLYATSAGGDVYSVDQYGAFTLDPAKVMKFDHYSPRETPTGAINGSNTTFTLAHTPISGTEHVFLNGILQLAGGGLAYTIAGATITYNTAPLGGSELVVSYWYS